MKLFFSMMIFFISGFYCLTVSGFDWSVNELQYQYGDLDTPEFAGGGSANTHIITFQHASGWKFGDNFLFIDHLKDNNSDSFNNNDWYGELYTNLSLTKVTGQNFSYGMIKDMGLLFGVNIGYDPKVYKYLPGLRLSWDIPGFKFLNTDFTAYIDDNAGIDDGGAPEESDSFMVDVNGAYPFSFGKHDFSIEGHTEYIGERTNELGFDVSDWFFSQIQFRYDLGKQIFNINNHLFIGIEWQLWINKLGDENTDENAVQALAVWRF